MAADFTGSINVASRVRFAVVGVGDIAQQAVLPAFRQARDKAELTALISGDPQKRARLARRYKVPITGGYEDYDALLASGAIDAVYVATPNDQHRDQAIRAARAGVHVLCEKPLAVTPADARAMRLAAERHDVRFMTAYRLHFDPATLTAIREARARKTGTLRLMASVFSSPVERGDIRLRAEGGGGLFDLGIYCVNAARMVFRSEPLDVVAMHAGQGAGRFREVPEMTTAILRYPGDRLALFVCSLAATRTNWWSAVGTKRMVRMEPAYHYAEPLTVMIRGARSERTRRWRGHDQFAPELLHFADCVQRGRTPEPSAREGEADVRILAGIDRAARSGRHVTFRDLPTDRAPHGRQGKALPAPAPRRTIGR